MKLLSLLLALLLATACAPDDGDAQIALDASIDAPALDSGIAIESKTEKTLGIEMPAIIYVKPASAGSAFTPQASARYDLAYTRVVPLPGTTTGQTYIARIFSLNTGYNNGKLQLQFNGSYGWCNYANGNSTIWTGMWCDGFWTGCPANAYMGEYSFSLWNSGVVGATNWNWFAPGSQTRNQYFDVNGYADYANMTANLAQPTVVNLAGGRVTFSCNYTPPSSFTLGPDMNGGV